MSSYAVFNPATVARLKANYANNSSAKTFIDSMIAFAYTSRNNVPAAKAVLIIEGELASNDAMIVGDDLDIAIASGMRYHFTGDHNALFTATRFLMSWAVTYAPIGNPITEEVFYKFVCAYDLVKDYVHPRQRRAIDAFLRRLFATGKAYTAVRIPALSHSNFESRHLSLMAAIAFTLGDASMVKYCFDFFKTQVDLNILAAGTVATSLPYLASAPEMAAHVNDPVEKGMSFDFIHRDAVEYHVASVGGLVFAAICARAQGQDWYGIVSTQGKRLEDGVAWALLYGDGTRTHMDFVGSFVSFDHEQNREAMFDPVHAQNMIMQTAMVAPKYVGMFSVSALPLWQRILYYAMT